jgi:hypothetical protein
MPLTVNVEEDPIKAMPWNIRRGLVIDGKRELRELIYRHGQTFCAEESPHNGSACTRPQGHPAWWKHIAADGYEIMSVWGGTAEAPKGGFVDPEDGTPEDPADVKVETVELGKVYRLRSRKNKLQVVGGVGEYTLMSGQPGSFVRPDGLIEVLDMTRREFRALPPEELVPTDEGLTFEEFQFTVQYASDTRFKIRDQGIENHHAGHWCAAGLDDALRDMGLPKYEPVQRGEIVVRIPYEALTTTKTTKVKDEVARVIDVDALKQLLEIEEDSAEDELHIKGADLALKIENVGRR